MKVFVKNLISILMFLLGVIKLQAIEPDAVQNSLSPKIIISPRECDGGIYGNTWQFVNFPIAQDIPVLMSRTANPNYRQEFILNLDENKVIKINGQKRKAFFSASGYYPGEKCFVRFIDSEGNIICESSYTPSPLYAKSKKSNFSVEAELLCLEPTIYALNIQGLNENEKYQTEMVSGPEKGSAEYLYKNNDAHLYIPAVDGKNGGVSKVKVIRSRRDYLVLNLSWGRKLEQDEKRKLRIQINN